MQALENELAARGLLYHRTREPGGTPLGAELRALILRKDQSPPVPRAELLMYEADRAQHVEGVVRPKLAEGVWVLSDRYKASSLAFQAGGREIEPADVEWLNHFATGGLEPDLTVLLDLPVEEARARRQGRESSGGGEADRIESEVDSFHERVRRSFLAQAAADPARWLVLSARETPAALLEKLMNELRSRAWLA